MNAKNPLMKIFNHDGQNYHISTMSARHNTPMITLLYQI